MFFLESLLRGIMDFFGVGENGLESAFDALFNLPLVDIRNPQTQVAYAVLWGGSLLLSVLTGAYSAIFYQRNRVIGTRLVSRTERVMWFVDNGLFGLFLFPLTATGLLLMDTLTDILPMLPFGPGSADALLGSYQSPWGFVTPPAYGPVMMILGSLLSLTVRLIMVGILVVLPLGGPARALRIMGNRGEAAWYRWVTWYQLAMVYKFFAVLIVLLGYYANAVAVALSLDPAMWVISPIVLWIAFRKPLKEAKEARERKIERSESLEMTSSPLTRVQQTGNTFQQAVGYNTKRTLDETPTIPRGDPGWMTQRLGRTLAEGGRHSKHSWAGSTAQLLGRVLTRR